MELAAFGAVVNLFVAIAFDTVEGCFQGSYSLETALSQT